jgi:hypothetical protein
MITVGPHCSGGGSGGCCDVNLTVIEVEHKTCADHDDDDNEDDDDVDDGYIYNNELSADHVSWPEQTARDYYLNGEPVHRCMQHTHIHTRTHNTQHTTHNTQHTTHNTHTHTGRRTIRRRLRQRLSGLAASFTQPA